MMASISPTPFSKRADSVTKCNETNMRKWIAALWDGTYEFNRYKLRDGDAFCSLGVACDIYDRSEWEERVVWTGEKVYYHGNDSCAISNDVARWLGLSEPFFSNGTVLVDYAAVSKVVSEDVLSPLIERGVLHKRQTAGGSMIALNDVNDILTCSFQDIARILSNVFFGTEVEDVVDVMD